MRYLKIVPGTSVDGPGLRTSVYFAGCSHHCHGCHNEPSWDFMGGEQIAPEALLQKLLENEEPVTLSGGDPLQQPHDELLALLKGLKAHNVNVWCFTGYTFEQLLTIPSTRNFSATSTSWLTVHSSWRSATPPYASEAAPTSASST